MALVPATHPLAGHAELSASELSAFHIGGEVAYATEDAFLPAR